MRTYQTMTAVLGLRTLTVLAMLVTTLLGPAMPAAAQGSVDVAIYTVENGQSAYDACYVIVGYSEVGCDENGDGKVTFAGIPNGTYTVSQTANLGPGRSVADFTITVTGSVNAEGYEGFTATIIGSGGSSSSASGQSIDLPIHAIGCSGPGACWNEVGAQFSVTTDGGEYLGSCELEGRRTTENGDLGLMLSCVVPVPIGSTVIVTEDVDTITQGYAPRENPIAFDVGDGPGNIVMSHWGVFFNNEPHAGNVSTGPTSDIAIVTTENGQPAQDACYILVGYGNEGCDENGDGKITFEDIPLGTWTVQQTADLGPGRSVPDFTINVTGAASDDGWERFPATITRTGGSASGSSPSSGSSGAIDIALITRDPDTGELLTGTCYVLIDYSNEGCDENGDGQVTFADVPSGTYTVRQTQTPAGYPTINDYDINVWPLGDLPDGSVLDLPLGFIVKQAPAQNDPGTLNVSVIVIDYATGEKVTSGVCVELVGGSNVGCDRDLVDGQIDFLDVPEGGPYELRFSNVPDGWQVGTDGQPYSVSVHPQPDTPANLFAFILPMGPDSGGASTSPGGGADGGAVIVPDSGTASTTGASDPGSSGEATLLMTYRGCPEGFDPAADDFYTNCTIPLDAPDNAFLDYHGEGQGGMNIAWMDRQHNGEYVYNAGPMTMSVELYGLAPVVRDDYRAFGADGEIEGRFTVNLLDGETREVFVFYWFS